MVIYLRLPTSEVTIEIFYDMSVGFLALYTRGFSKSAKRPEKSVARDVLQRLGKDRSRAIVIRCNDYINFFTALCSAGRNDIKRRWMN